METVGIPSSRHNTSGKLVHYQHLVVLYHIILIPEHQIICPKGQGNVVLDLNILRVCKVVYLEEFLHFLHALGRKVDHLVLLVYDKVPGFLPFHTHNGVHLG